MRALGHAAVGWLVVDGRRGRRSWAGVFAVLGALGPDLIDKSARALQLTPYSRWVGHTLWLWAALALVWWLWRRAPLGWLLAGGLSHLGADLLSDLLVGVFQTGVMASGWMFYPLVEMGALGVVAAGPVFKLWWAPWALELWAVGWAALALRGGGGGGAACDQALPPFGLSPRQDDPTRSTVEWKGEANRGETEALDEQAL